MQAIDLLPCCLALRAIQLACSRASQPPLRAVHNGGYHLHIAPQCGGCCCGGLLLLPLRFEKQLRLLENALAGHRRAVAPSGVQLAGLPRIAVMLRECRRHSFAVLQADARHWQQKLHGHVCGDLALTHLLLDGFRQKLRQRQPPRYPAHAAVEPARQLLEPVAEAPLQLGQQPAHLQRGLLFGPTQRAVQQHRRGLAHGPDHRLHRVPAQLLQRRDSLVAVDDHVTIRGAFRCHHHDGRLLPRFG